MRVEGLGFTATEVVILGGGFGFRVQGSGFRVCGHRSSYSGWGVRVQGLGFAATEVVILGGAWAGGAEGLVRIADSACPAGGGAFPDRARVRVSTAGSAPSPLTRIR